MAVDIVGTPWGRQYLTPEVRADIVAMVPERVATVSIAARRRPGDWSAYLFGTDRNADPLGTAHERRTIPGAVAAAIRDMELGPALTWCSTCPEPATYQRNGEASCASCTRGGTVG